MDKMCWNDPEYKLGLEVYKKLFFAPANTMVTLTYAEEAAYKKWAAINPTKPVFKREHDAVNHPKHYTSHPSGVECITITRHMTFNCGNAVKYLWRNGLKDGAPSIQDLEKAIWYINDEIKTLKEKEAKND